MTPTAVAARKAMIRWLIIAAAGLLFAATPACSHGPAARADAGDADALHEGRPDLAADLARDVGSDRAADGSPPSEAGERSDLGASADVADHPDEEAGDDAGDDGSDGPTACGARAAHLTLPAQVSGVLSGVGEVDLTSCSATPGPDRIFSFTITELSVLEVDVTSQMSTVLAVRRACADLLTEIACAQQSSRDAGATNGTLRVPLTPGDYVLILDEVGALAGGGAFTLQARIRPHSSNASCAAPKPLVANLVLPDELIDPTADMPVACDIRGPSLFYTVDVPAGQRLRVHATPLGGSSTLWSPLLSLFSSCAADTCLNYGLPDLGPEPSSWATYVNEGAVNQKVMLAVGTYDVSAARSFSLEASFDDPLAACAAALPIGADGKVLVSDLGAAPSQLELGCYQQTAHVRYYRTRVLAMQTLSATATAHQSPVPFEQFAALDLHRGCGSSMCIDTAYTDESQSRLKFTNPGPDPIDVVIGVRTIQPPNGEPPVDVIPAIDLSVDLPPPPAGVRVVPRSGLRTTEAGGQATFQVTLTSAPTAPVILGLTSSAPGEGVVAPASLTFDASDWHTSKTVTVTGVDDHVSDGDRDYLVVTAPASSADARYAGIDPPDVSVTNLDDEPGFRFAGTSALGTSESGTTATFTTQLITRPTATVRLPLASTDVTEAVVTPTELVFDPQSWNVPQTVTVTGKDDDLHDGVRTYAIAIGPAVSSDPVYAGMDPRDLPAANNDNDYGPVAPALVTGSDQSCLLTGWGAAALDAFNTIYIATSCEGGGYVTTSRDGGNTFSALSPFGLVPTGEVAVAGGRAGVATVAANTLTGLYITRTDDEGVTWAPPQLLQAAGGDNLTLSSAGDLVLVTVNDPLQESATRLWRSVDGGQTFEPSSIIAPAAPGWRAHADRDGRTVWLTNVQETQVLLLKSVDAGKTFGDVVTLPLQGIGAVAMGRNKLFAVSVSDVTVVNLGDVTDRQVIPLPIMPSIFAAVADWIDDLIVLADENTIQAFRLPAGGSAFASSWSIGVSDQPATGLPLATNTLGVVSGVAGLVLFTAQTWP